MTYVVPHFRYGALVFHDIRRQYEKKSRNNRQGKMEQLLR